MKRTLLTLFATALAASAQGPGPGRGPGGRMGFGPPDGPGARILGAEAGMPGRTVKNAPYTAEIVTESTQTLPDGNRIRRSNTVKVARDSEGRTRRELSPDMSGLTTNSNMGTLIFIHDPVAGVAFDLNSKDKTGSRSTFKTGNGPGRGPNSQMSAGRGPQGRGPQPKAGEAAGRPHRNATNDPNFKTESLGT